MEDRRAQFDAAFKRLASDVASTLAMESALAGKGPVKNPKTRSRSKKSAAANQSVAVDPEPRDPLALLDEVLVACKRRRREVAEGQENTTPPELINKLACFTDKFKLAPYKNFMHYVPRLVNVVTVCSPPTLQASIPSSPTAPVCAARRGHPRPRQRSQAAARPAPHRRALPQLLLRAQEVQRGAAGLLGAALPCIGLP
jgi:hypothetical protein